MIFWLYFVHILFVWIKFSTSDICKNLLSDCVFCEKRHSDSHTSASGMNVCARARVGTVRICCVVWVKFHVLDLHIIPLMDCELYFLMGINESKCTCIPCTMWHCKTKKCLHKVCVLVAEYTIYCVLYDITKLRNGFIKSVYWNFCSSWMVWLLKMGLIDCPRLLVNNYQTPPCNSPEERKFNLHHSRSPKSHLCTGHRVYCLHSFNWISQQDAANSQVYYLSFRYSSTCFGASSCPSSGATTTAVAASGLPSELGDSSAVGRGRRPDRDQQHCYHQAPTVNRRLLLQLL
jgi:hypothetical protein